MTTPKDTTSTEVLVACTDHTGCDSCWSFYDYRSDITLVLSCDESDAFAVAMVRGHVIIARPESKTPRMLDFAELFYNKLLAAFSARQLN